MQNFWINLTLSPGGSGDIDERIEARNSQDEEFLDKACGEWRREGGSPASGGGREGVEAQEV